MHYIVFIEGVSGAGKTTTATYLYNRLLKMDYNVKCYLEGDSDNPLDPFEGKFPPPMTSLMFSDTYLKCWENFSKNNRQNGLIYILDGTLFHHQINDLIREYKASDDYIINHLSNILHYIQNFNPIVFYLSSNDVGMRLRLARERRKQSISTDEKIDFWENRKRIDLYALKSLSIESHTLNVDDGWNEAVEIMYNKIKF